jgi:nickel/cobalt exporter
MNPADLIAHSSLAWLMATGLLLGALHALEPGHAKTMIASFVVATRGSVPQAILLGLSAALSHSLLVWVLAGAALYFGDRYIGDDAEPWLQLVSGLIIVAIGATMLWRLDRSRPARVGGTGPQGGRLIDMGDSLAELAVFEDGVPPEFRLFAYDRARRPAPPPQGVSVRTIRPDGTTQEFAFAERGACLVSTDPIPEPHEFEAILSVPHDHHAHEYSLAFAEHHDHGHHHDHDHDHDHDHHHRHGKDAHARAHARQIERHLDGRTVTTRQIALFGLSSGLMPCPAALTMLLVCLRLKRIALGAGLVGAFSAGLAITLVGLGVVASIGVAQASKRLPAFDRWSGVLPYISGAMIIAVGLFMGVSGYVQLA